MTPSTDDERRIRRAISRGNFVRRPTVRLSDLRGHKEWMHFCASTAELDVFVNFSIVDDLRLGAPRDAEIARLVCAVRGEDWDGDVDEFGVESVRAQPGQMNMRVGPSGVYFCDGVYRVVAKLERRPIELDLVFRPTTIATQINNIALGDGPPLKWFLVPRLLASGVMRVGDERYELRDVPAYHDHNWGYFTWGQDFSWVWGYANAHPLGSDWSVAFDRLTDKGHTSDFLRGLVLWRGARQYRVFGGREITCDEVGHMLPKATLKLPRVMSLLRSEMTVNVPSVLCARAAGRGDVLEMIFTAENVCQIVAPNDTDDLGVTVINEVSGTVRLDGSVLGERVKLEGRGMFEFLHG
jgi:hypothetical protein